jgi:sugar/nucleoside kinase (ribokinase family)
MFDLVGIGNPVYDTIITPFSRTEDRVLSGCSTNSCLAAKRLGLNSVGLVGRIGSDYAERLRADLRKYGITADLDSTDSQTAGFHLQYDRDGNRTLDVIGIAEKITPKNIPDIFLDSRFFLIGPILGEVNLELIEYVKTSSNGALFLDPQGLIRLVGDDGKINHMCDREQFRKIAELVDFVKPNEPESAVITGHVDPVQALKDLRDMGVKLPIITLAERGSVLLDETQMYNVPAYRTKAIDPTGAGDVYGGSFIVEYSKSHRCVEAALFASAASSIKVEQVGPDFQLTAEEAERRTESIRGRLVKM